MKRGFTLIELLIVIAVIAILVGITVPRFMGMRDEGLSAKAAAECNTLKAALEAYRIHETNNDFPAEAATWQNSLVAARPQILEAALNDPFSGSPYLYQLSTDGEYYVVYSVGHDREADIDGIGTDGVPTTGGTCTKYTATCDADEDVFSTNGTAP